MGTEGKVLFLPDAQRANSTLTEWEEYNSGNTNSARGKDAKMPLAYYRGQYRHVARDYQRPSLAAYYDEDFE